MTVPKKPIWTRAPSSTMGGETVRANQEHARDIIDHTLAFVGVLRPDGTLADANATALRAGGLTREDVLEKKFWDCYWWNHDEHVQQQLRESVRQAAAGRIVRYQVVVRMAHDSRMPVDFMLAPVRDSQGQITQLIASGIDISERKQAEELLRRFELLAEHSRDILLFIDRNDGRILEANRAAFKAYGYSREELLGLTIHDLRAKATRSLTAEQMATAESQGILFETIHQRKDGSTFPVEVSSQGAQFGESHTLISVIRDITERYRAQEQLRQHAEQLEQAVQERTAKLQELVAELEHFSYSLVHDMRAPLRAMRGFAEMAAQRCGESDQPELKEFLRRISVSADRMDNLITDALNYNRAIRQELPLEPLDIRELLRGILESYPEFQPSKAHVRLENDIPLVLGNQAGLTQCFSNLLGNAVKFVESGRKPEVHIRAERRDGWIRIWVIDNGIGISQTMLPRVFHMFSRGQISHEGTGIGLALVRKVVDRMGGRVGVESELGKGSRFWVELKSAEANLFDAEHLQAR